MSVADMSSELPGLGVSGRLYRHVGDKLAWLETWPLPTELCQLGQPINRQLKHMLEWSHLPRNACKNGLGTRGEHPLTDGYELERSVSCVCGFMSLSILAR